MSAVTTLDVVKMIALAYREKSDNGKKSKANKSNFLSYFWQQTVSLHYQVSQKRRNEIIQMGQDLHQSLSTSTSL